MCCVCLHWYVSFIFCRIYLSVFILVFLSTRVWVVGFTILLFCVCWYPWFIVCFFVVVLSGCVSVLLWSAHIIFLWTIPFHCLHNAIYVRQKFHFFLAPIDVHHFFLIEGKSCLFMSIQEMKFLVMVLLIMTRYFELQKQWNVHVLFSPYPFQSWQKLLLSGYYNFLSFSLSSFSTRCLQFMRLFFDIGASSMCC